LGRSSQSTVLVLFAYPITTFVVETDWGRVARDTLAPSLPHTETNAQRWLRFAAPRSVRICFSAGE
jgi:hypothetical protein